MAVCLRSYSHPSVSPFTYPPHLLFLTLHVTLPFALPLPTHLFAVIALSFLQPLQVKIISIQLLFFWDLTSSLCSHIFLWCELTNLSLCQFFKNGWYNKLFGCYNNMTVWLQIIYLIFLCVFVCLTYRRSSLVITTKLYWGGK